jgi:hypothetical protein
MPYVMRGGKVAEITEYADTQLIAEVLTPPPAVSSAAPPPVAGGLLVSGGEDASGLTEADRC